MLGKDKILKHCKHGNDLILDTHDVLIGKIFIIFFNGNNIKNFWDIQQKILRKCLTLKSLKEFRYFNRELFLCPSQNIGDKTIKNLKC